MGRYLRRGDEAKPVIQPLTRVEASHLVALARLHFPLVPAPYEGRPWFLPVVGEYFRARDRLAGREKAAPYAG